MSVVLSYPFTTPTNTVTLRNDELRRIEQRNIKTKVQVAMDGTVYTHKYTPFNTKLIMNFQTVTTAIRDSLLTFLLASYGREIKLVDADGVIWKGELLDEPFESIEQRVTCSNSFTLEFEGVLIPAGEQTLAKQDFFNIFQQDSSEILLQTST